MPSRFRPVLIALLATLALVGCGSATDPLAPKPSPSAIPDRTATPHGAIELEGRLPDSIGGTTLGHSSFDGRTFLATGTPTNREALTTMLAELGHGVDDLSLAQATDPAGKLAFVEGIFRVAGAPPDALERAWLAAQETATGGRLVEGKASIGGTTVTKLSDPDLTSGGTTYVIARQDTLVLILADDEALVAEAIGKIH